VCASDQELSVTSYNPVTEGSWMQGGDNGGLHRRWDLLRKELETRALPEALERARVIEDFLLGARHPGQLGRNNTTPIGYTARSEHGPH